MAKLTALNKSKINIKFVRGREGLSSIKHDWEYISNSINNKHFFHLFQWYKSYIDSLENDDLSVYFFLFYENKEPIAIFPLKKLKKKILGLGFDVLEIPNHPHNELSDFIFRKQDRVHGLIIKLTDYLREEKSIYWDFICLPHILEDSQVFHDINCSSKFIAHEIISKCNYIKCISYDELYNNLSKNFRGNLRKAKNKLLRFGNVEFDSVRKGKELLQGFKEFLHVEASGWKGEQGTRTAIILNPKITGFYECLLENYSKINGCEIDLLKVSGECIAGQFCLLVDDTVYVLKIGYNEKYSKFAPGNMLLENLIKRLSNEENIKYVNLITDYKWHDNWKPLFYKVFAIYIFNKSFFGIVGLYMLKLKQFLRSIYRLHINPILHMLKKLFAKIKYFITAVQDILKRSIPPF